MNAPEKKPYSAVKIIRLGVSLMLIHAKDRMDRARQVGINMFMGPVLSAPYYLKIVMLVSPWESNLERAG